MAWDVFLDGALLDTVHFLRELDAEYVRRALIGHDGFPAGIEVRPAAARQEGQQ